MPTDAVDIYDDSTGTWSTYTLSAPRSLLAATTVGTKAIFAGGFGGTGVGMSAVVDIYDDSTGTWSTAVLSEARSMLAATTVGTKALIAGGMNSSYAKTVTVDVYDDSTGTWSVAALSTGHAQLSATSVGSEAIFAGDLYGSSVIDMYDDSTGTWSTDTQSTPRAFLRPCATTVGVKAMFAGGTNSGAQWDVIDIYTGTGPPPPYTPYCFGSASAGNPCPCGNDNDGSDPAGAGCANGTFAAGAKLAASGSPSVSADTLLLTGTRGQPGNSSMFFQAANNLDGTGVFLGDGIRCAGGNLKRLKVKLNDANGDASTSGTVISARSAQLGYTIQPGDILRYQWWYRDTNNPPCGLGVNDSNTSNGLEITWQS